MSRAAALVVALILGGCGDQGEGPGEPLRVSAAASLKSALTAHAPGVSYSFAGSDELAAQIRQGGRPDVFVAANATLPDALHREGLVERPVVFATNRLVVAVADDAARIRRLEDLAGPGVRIAAGAAGVPVGAYTEEFLNSLDPAEANRIRANIRSREPDVVGVVGKLTQGAVDAGFVYATDVQPPLRAIRIAAREVRYAAAVVRGAPRAAREFVGSLPSARALRDAGFGPP